MDIIDIDKESIPYSFSILLDKELYELHVDYNSRGDFFTMGIYRDSQPLCTGERIVYGVPLFRALRNRGGFPRLNIIPTDPSMQSDGLSYDNLGSTVFLAVEEGPG